MVWDILHYPVKGGVYIEMGVVFLGGLGFLTPQNNGWCCDRDEGGVNRVRGSVYRWLGVPYKSDTVLLCPPNTIRRHCEQRTNWEYT